MKALKVNNMYKYIIGFFVCLFVCLLFVFLPFSWATSTVCGGSQARGLNRSCSCQPTPEPQQLGIRAVSAAYTTAHGNARSLTHWTRPGIEPTTSWYLVGFISTLPRWEVQRKIKLKFFIPTVLILNPACHCHLGFVFFGKLLNLEPLQGNGDNSHKLNCCYVGEVR